MGTTGGVTLTLTTRKMRFLETMNGRRFATKRRRCVVMAMRLDLLMAEHLPKRSEHIEDNANGEDHRGIAGIQAAVSRLWEGWPTYYAKRDAYGRRKAIRLA